MGEYKKDLIMNEKWPPKVPKKISAAIIFPWEDNKKFRLMWGKFQELTRVYVDRSHILYQFCREALLRRGSVAEVGVYKGGTAKLLAMIIKDVGVDRTLHLFDTFEGMPEVDPQKDKFKKGSFGKTSIELVKKNLVGYDNVKFWKGFFPDTAEGIRKEKFCFVHVDCDIYRSVLDCCKFFYERMVEGGVMVFDDYGFKSCPGAKIAVDEFFSNKQETPIVLVTGQCVFIKRG